MSRLLHPRLHLTLTVVLITISEIFLKLGADETAHAHDWLGTASLGTRSVWIGAALLAVSSITWIITLRAMPLYLAFTLCSVIHVTIPLSSWLILGDHISPLRWLGIAFVLGGVWIIARPASAIEERA